MRILDRQLAKMSKTGCHFAFVLIELALKSLARLEQKTSRCRGCQGKRATKVMHFGQHFVGTRNAVGVFRKTQDVPVGYAAHQPQHQESDCESEGYASSKTEPHGIHYYVTMLPFRSVSKRYHQRYHQ